MRRFIILAFTYALVLGTTEGAELKTVEDWARGLESPQAHERREAAYALSRMGALVADVVPDLIRALDDSEQQVWFGAVTALANAGPAAKEAVPALIGDLDSRQERGWRRRYWRQVWYRSAYALQAIGPEAIPALLKALESDRDTVRAGAAKALGWLGESAGGAAPRLIPLLADPAEMVRRETSEALGQMGAGVLALLRETLQQEDPLLQRGAIKAIGASESTGKRTHTALMAVLNSDAPAENRAACVEALRKTGCTDEQFVSRLVELLDAKEEALRHAALDALLLLSPAEELTVPILTRHLLEGPTDGERIAALLGEIGSPARSAVPRLIEALSDADPKVRRYACTALGRLGKRATEAVPGLQARLEDDCPSVVEQARKALSAINQPP